MDSMTRQEACRELGLIGKKYPSTPEECERVGQAVVMAQAALNDKKARYWKRRWLRQRDNIYYVINILNETGHTTTAKFIESVIIKENKDEMDTSNLTRQSQK